MQWVTYQMLAKADMLVTVGKDEKQWFTAKLINVVWVRGTEWIK
jgi:hypothetical protein